MKHLFFIALLGCFAQSLHGQAGDSYCFLWQNPLPQGNPLSDVFFVDTKTGWSVGDRGTILHTTDGGATWKPQQSETLSDFIGVHFTDNQKGWVVGSSGTIMYTSNGGAVWQPQTSGTSNILRAVYFVDSQTGWVVGNNGTIRHTSNGGASWLPQTSGISSDLRGVCFFDSQNGWAVGSSGTILRTTNGGASWLPQTSGTSNILRGVCFTDSQSGWAVGDGGLILHTTDGGQNWLPLTFVTSEPLYAVFFSDSQTGWAVGDGGTILYTSDGANWQPQPSGFSNTLYGVHCTDGQTGWAVGIGGMILHSLNSGANWQRQSSSATLYGLRDVHFTDSQTGWVVGGGNSILHTSNGGGTWQSQTAEASNALYGVYFTDSQTGWAVGSEGTILHTSDGMTWQPQTSGFSNVFWSVHFSDSQTGRAVGNNGAIRYTSNGGANWQAQSSGTSIALRSVYFIDNQTGWAVGDDGTVIHTSNGTTWQPQISATTEPLYGVYFFDNLNGWAVGDGGTICHTSDGGMNWQVQPSGTVRDLKAVHFTDSQTGWVAGLFGTILKTTDGGLSWKEQASVTSNYLFGVYFTDNQNGWVIGVNGTVINITTTCNSYTNTLSGTLFRDSGNCFYDTTEQTLPQWLIKAESDSLTFYATTDTAGHFSMLVDTGTYSVSAVLPNGLWTHCDTIQVAFDQFYQALDTVVGILATDACPLLTVDIGTPRLRYCFDNFYHITYSNEGTTVAESTYIELTFAPGLDVDTSTLPDPWEPFGENAFRIQLGDVPPLAHGSFSVKVKVNCGSTKVGERKCATAHIYPDFLCLPALGWDESDIVVTARCSGDTVFFTMKNNGTGDMEGPKDFIIIEETVMSLQGTFKLDAGADTVVFVSNAANKTWRLEAEQHADHPFSKAASVTTEGCPEFTNFSVFLQYPQDEARPYEATDCHPIVSSWDPNDKQAFPQGLGDEYSIRDNTPLEYLVHFQNTGTDTAFHVVVRDTLSPSLDIETLHPGASSHPYQFKIVRNDVLEFIFDDIMLPDSNTNEAASNGFVQFFVRQKSLPVNPPGTKIENKAAIYFDYNPPVLTNTVSHMVAEPVMYTFRDTVCKPGGPTTISADTSQFSYFKVVHETLLAETLYTSLDTAVQLGDTVFGIVVLSPVTIVKTLTSANGCDSILTVSITIPTTEPADALPFRLFPNPTGGDLTLRFTPEMRGEVTSVEICDATGRLRLVYLPPAGTKGSSITLPVLELPGGVYWLTVRSANGTWAGRFVKIE